MSSPSSSQPGDVIVVGGGPAGSTAARRLVLSGWRVLLLERDRFPRYKSCGGAVTEGVERLVDFDIGPAVERTVGRVVFSYRGKGHRPIKGTEELVLSMVMRSNFDQLLLSKAREAGVEVREGEQVVALSHAPEGVVLRTQAGSTYRGRACIGADGAASRIARLAGLAPPRPAGLGLAAELRLPEEDLEAPSRDLELDFGGVRSGYRWVFPKRGQVSIGVCTTGDDGQHLKESLKDYIESHRLLRRCEVMLVKAHPIPFYTRGRRLQSHGVVLVGDAAGLADPLTGEGIVPALKSASIAARCVEEFLLGQGPLEAYEARIDSEIGRDFDYACGFAEVFHARPFMGYLAGVASRTVARALLEVLMGRATYEEAYQTVAATVAGRLGRWLRPAQPVRKDPSAAAKVAS